MGIGFWVPGYEEIWGFGGVGVWGLRGLGALAFFWSLN